MSAATKGRKVLIVSSGDKLYEYFCQMLPASEGFEVRRAKTAGEGKRLLSRVETDIVIIDSPLTDESGIDFALSIGDTNMGVMIVVKSELYDQVAYKVEEKGILTVAKPNSKQTFYGAVKLLVALRCKICSYEKKNESLQEKMQDIRAVNRAKWLLIEKMNMSEKDAHYFIEKRAMDARISRREVAENLIRTYDN